MPSSWRSTTTLSPISGFTVRKSPALSRVTASPTHPPRRCLSRNPRNSRGQRRPERFFGRPEFKDGGFSLHLHVRATPPHDQGRPPVDDEPMIEHDAAATM